MIFKTQLIGQKQINEERQNQLKSIPFFSETFKFLIRVLFSNCFY